MQSQSRPIKRPGSRALRSAFCAILVATVLSGCASKYVFVDADELCQSWKHQTVSKADVLSEGTARIAEGNNNSRPAWGCARGQNKAKQP